MIMMSIFSSFDAFCAESFGQRIGFSVAPAKKESPANQAPGVDRNSVLLSASRDHYKEGNSPCTSPAPVSARGDAAPRNPPKQRKPRFAPELDGVHCFETIVPY